MESTFSKVALATKMAFRVDIEGMKNRAEVRSFRAGKSYKGIQLSNVAS